MKMDDFLTTLVATPNQLVEAEALLKTLQDKIQVIHRYDAEIELLLDDDDDQMSQDREFSPQFHHNASVTVARLSALIDNSKRASDVTGNSSRTSTNNGSQNSSELKLPKLQFPS